MYLIGEMCMNPNVKGNICEECGLCGRDFIDGHIVNEHQCGECYYYDRPMSECLLKPNDLDGFTGHRDAFVRSTDTCDNWEDVKRDC